MKKYSIYLFVLFAFVSAGCNKYLDQAPDERTTLNNPSKVSELLVTAYPRANHVLLAESMSDIPAFVSATGIDFPVNQDGFFWKDVEATDQDSPTYYWNACYTAIGAANQALVAIAKASDPQAYSSQKGEALVARAYSHFMLVTLFSKCYDPITAETDLGVPYVTEPETIVFKKYDRKTVAYVYQQIEKDILEGIPLIVDNYKVPAYHFTRKAAYAFACRYYLFKKDAAKVIEYANLTFPSNNFAENVRPWKSYSSFNSTQIEAAYTNASSPGNLLLAETVSRLARNYKRPVYSVSQNRLNGIIAPVGTPLNSYKIFSNSSTFYYVLKFVEHFVRTNINATTGTGYVMVPLLTTEEVLLNRAEAYITQEKYPEALADMNTLISTRVTTYTPATQNLTETKIKTFYAGSTTDTKQAFFNALLDLKKAEFVHEGMRWLDILRHKLPVVHANADGAEVTLKAEDNRKLWQVPAEVTLSGVEQNPR
ncbi:RagB/SusD family nutrient uptake outer membrane protein [Pedobacter hiemivivus]|uniref:RagB/SusD family nutrient uptake outer membrane protein n=1 Tax=Pedobacter hiemivivus TaxID=2530454 RepID=A0A4U1GLC4_9SPHI|nr:RagB/SusD family nutrient uptake outer membrane protein [Pedobacter hiemivivus]TKC65048.1 RagB/SusD family nutrient uptake outer membrane protein [Pedobacter hiemivivus]